MSNKRRRRTDGSQTLAEEFDQLFAWQSYFTYSCPPIWSSLRLVSLCPDTNMSNLYKAAENILTEHLKRHPLHKRLLNTIGGKSLPTTKEAMDKWAKTEEDDAETRFDWLYLAAVQKDKEAQYLLGRAYEDGKGIVPNHEKAMYWCELAAALGHAEAQMCMGRDFEKHKAIHWYTKAAAQNHAEAHMALALLEKDIDKSMEHYRKANTTKAHFALGMIYQDVKKNEKEAGIWYRKAAEANHAQAQFRLGEILSSDEEGMEWLEKAAKQGNSDAQYAYALCLEKKGGDDDLRTAIGWFVDAATQGHEKAFTRCEQESMISKSPTAQNAVGYCYHEGIAGVDKNADKAFQWFHKSALQGNAFGQRNMGLHYREQEGLHSRNAFEWYLLSAQQGNADSQHDVALFYEREKNFEKALYWYKLAADQNLAVAQNNLGCLYQAGKGVVKNNVKALEYFRLAATQCVHAQYNLGRYYHLQDRDVKQALKWYGLAAKQKYATAQQHLSVLFAEIGDKPASMYWHHKAAENGDILAQYHLGNCYMLGEGEGGIKIDQEIAFSWYEKAANQNHRDAQAELGTCYENGQGVKADPTKAFYWYQKAADQNVAYAQNNLGCCYEHGRGVFFDQEKVMYWFTKAAENGDVNAQRNLGNIYFRPESKYKNLKEAAKWYKLGAEQNDSRSQYGYGCCLLSSYTMCYSDEEKLNKERTITAYQYFQKAAEAGHAEAQRKLAFHYLGNCDDQSERAKALPWLKKAAEAGDARSQYHLGKCYTEGTMGVDRDEQTALDWYWKAARQGYWLAKIELKIWLLQQEDKEEI